MGTINSSDIIYATLSQHGRQLASLRLSGLTSFSDILCQVRRAFTGSLGLVTLRLRNSSQGWSHDRSVILMPAPHVPVQLSLF